VTGPFDQERIDAHRLSVRFLKEASNVQFAGACATTSHLKNNILRVHARMNALRHLGVQIVGARSAA
jgi:hypothetical protein